MGLEGGGEMEQAKTDPGEELNTSAPYPVDPRTSASKFVSSVFNSNFPPVYACLMLCP